MRRLKAHKWFLFGYNYQDNYFRWEQPMARLGVLDFDTPQRQ
jgi:hypothetical protein